MGKHTLGDEGGYVDRQGMDTLVWQLVDIGEEFILEMLLRLNSCPDSIKGKLGCPLTPWVDCAVVDDGLESLSIFALKHHLKLLPASLVAISFIGIDVKGFQVI